MREFHDTLGWVVAGACLTALGCIAFAFLALYVRRHCREWLERAEWMTRHPSCLLAAPLVIALLLYGGEKQRQMFSFGKNLEDNGSWATNNTVCVKWLYYNHDGSDLVNIAYKELTSGDAYNLLAQVAASEYVWEAEIINATNYDYKVYFEEKTPDADRETFVAQIYIPVQTESGDAERMVPVNVDVSVDGNGVFEFIPRPAWPTNTVDEANAVNALSDDEVIEAFQNEGTEVTE